MKKLPKVTLFSTGNEIIPLNMDLEMGKVYDINSHTFFVSYGWKCFL